MILPGRSHPALRAAASRGLDADRWLSDREKQVLVLLASGHGNKQIAYELGISSSSVASHIRKLLRRLRLRSLAELAVVFRHGVSRERRAGIVVMTAAERAVARAAMDGLTNAEIARRRGTSPRTVANQLFSVFRKLGISSRRELFLVGAVQTDDVAPVKNQAS